MTLRRFFLGGDAKNPIVPAIEKMKKTIASRLTPPNSTGGLLTGLLSKRIIGEKDKHQAACKDANTDSPCLLHSFVSSSFMDSFCQSKLFLLQETMVYTAGVSTQRNGGWKIKQHTTTSRVAPGTGSQQNRSGCSFVQRFYSLFLFSATKKLTERPTCMQTPPCRNVPFLHLLHLRNRQKTSND